MGFPLKEFKQRANNSPGTGGNQGTALPFAPATRSLVPVRRALSIGNRAAITADSASETPTELWGQVLEIRLGTLLEQIPPELLAPGPHDSERNLQFPIEELFAGIARAMPIIPLSLVAKEYPALFRSGISHADDFQIRLPLPELVVQIDAFPFPEGQKPAPTLDPTPIAIGRADQKVAVGKRLSNAESEPCVLPDEALGLADVAALIAEFPSVQGCIIQGAEEAARAGAIPDRPGLSDLADAESALFEPVGRFAARLEAGEVQSLSIETKGMLVTLFRSGPVTLLVRHEPDDFQEDLRAQLKAITAELARLH
jgi:predicted regulator of Ras-like GTPase activity (Roadblock/LC7/MglB family)